MKYCPYCGAGFSDDTASFCTECGKKVPESKDFTPAEKKLSKGVHKKKMSKVKKEKKVK